MVFLTCIPIMVVIFCWMGQTHQAGNTTKLGRSLSFRDINQIKHAFGVIEAEMEMKTLRKELEQMIGHDYGDMLWIANMAKSGLAEIQRIEWMPRKLRWMNEDLAGLMDPFILYNDGIMELATQQFDNLEEEMRKAGIPTTNSAQHRSRTIMRTFLNKEGSKKVKKNLIHQRGSLEKKMLNELRVRIILSMHAANGKIKALLDRYLRMHLIVQLKNAGIRMVDDGIGLFWWAKGQHELEQEDGTDCCFEGMEAAYEEIGRWLALMGGNGKGQEGNDGGNKNIRIDPKMAAELNKIKQEGNDRFDGDIFKELTGRTNITSQEDRMEWQTIILLGHVLHIYYEEEKKINKKIPDSPADDGKKRRKNAIDDDDESHPPKKRKLGHESAGPSSFASPALVNQQKTLEGIFANASPQMLVPDLDVFSDILHSPNGLMGLVDDLKILINFDDQMMNGLNAEMKGLANWAEFLKYCAAQIGVYSRLVRKGVKLAIEKGRKIKQEFIDEFKHLNIFRQSSDMNMSDSDILEVSFIAKLLTAIDEVKAKIPTKESVEELTTDYPDAVPKINELKSILVTLDKNADMLKHFLQNTKNVRQLFTPKIDFMEDGKEMKGKGKETAEGTSSSPSPHLLHQQQQKLRIQDIYHNALEDTKIIKILAELSLEAIELHLWLKSFDLPNVEDHIKKIRQHNVQVYFLSLKTFLKKEMNIHWEEQESFLEGLKMHIDTLVKEMTDEDGLPGIWQVKLLNLIVPLVQHYNQIMGQ